MGRGRAEDEAGAAGVPVKAIAFIWCYNEEDIIGHVVNHLHEQGIMVRLLDNWSTDSTIKVACPPATCERWPGYEPTVASWRAMLEHTEELALEYAEHTHEPFWAIHHDADEIRRSPWMG